MRVPFPEHPPRHVVTAELHAHTFESMRIPVQVTHIAYPRGGRGSGLNVRHLRRLLEHFDLPATADPGQQFFVDVGNLRLYWERHTEFVTYSFARQGRFERPFAELLVDELPADWLQELPGKVETAVLLALEPREGTEPTRSVLTDLFGDNPVIGAEVASALVLGAAWSGL